jgi:outer membrane protein FlgP
MAFPAKFRYLAQFMQEGGEPVGRCRICPSLKKELTALTHNPLVGLTFGLILLSGCDAPGAYGQNGAGHETAAQQLAATEAALDKMGPTSGSSVTAASTVPTIQGIGYAVVSVQPGRNTAQKTLLAIRAARMDAMRALAEQIHGLSIDSRTTMAEAVVQSDTLRATVTGVIRGARTVHIEPQSADVYEVLLEVDRAMIDHMLRIARRGRI